MNFDPYLRSIPMALPGTVIAAVLLALTAAAVSRRWNVNGWAFWCFATALAGFAALTLTPTSGALDGYKQGSTGFSLHVTLPTATDLGGLNDVSLNIFAGAVVAATAVVFARSLQSLAPVAIALLAPPAAELVQWALPQLGRSGFLLTDVIQNWTGMLFGAAAAGLAILATRSLLRPVQADAH